MKTALLHYWLTNMRGGEKVLAALGEMLPDADIFTHAYIPEKVPEFSRFNVSESFIARLPLGRKHPQGYLPFMPVAPTEPISSLSTKIQHMVLFALLASSIACMEVEAQTRSS